MLGSVSTIHAGNFFLILRVEKEKVCHICSLSFFGLVYIGSVFVNIIYIVRLSSHTKRESVDGS